jgi:type IV pilus biogenesis protein CpaD/CtpE
MNEKSRVDRDLAALRKLSTRDVPDLDTTIQTIRQRGLDSGPWLGNFGRKAMALLHSVRTRPAVAAAAVGVLAVLVAMVVPVSYDRVAAQDVALTVTGKGIGNQEITGLVQGFKGALGAKSVMVEAASGSEGSSFVLHATLPKRSGAAVQRATAEFARELAAKGYSASVRVTPRHERVRYPAVAYALDQIIRISVDGKAAAALEQEIRDRLAQAGVPDAQVSVTDRPEGGREVRLAVERERDANAPPTQPEPMPQLVLTKNGAPLAGGEGLSVKIQKRVVNGATSLVVEVTSNGKSARVEVANSDTMSDAALSDAIASQLKQAGIDARVTVTGGKISIESAK